MRRRRRQRAGRGKRVAESSCDSPDATSVDLAPELSTERREITFMSSTVTHARIQHRLRGAPARQYSETFQPALFTNRTAPSDGWHQGVPGPPGGGGTAA